jgi:hypothetical protein
VFVPYRYRPSSIPIQNNRKVTVLYILIFAFPGSRRKTKCHANGQCFIKPESGNSYAIHEIRNVYVWSGNRK